MVRSIRCWATDAQSRGGRVAGRMAMVAFWCLGMAASLPAQPPVHYYHQGIMPPGAIGSLQLQRGGPVSGFFQPVEIKVPSGALISLATAARFDEAQAGPRKAGLLIGAVYRLRVTNIRLAEGAEVFPTIEVIDRLYAPPDQARRFSIPIDITEEDLKLAIVGKFVTRVIYLEDPLHALPARENPPAQNWFEVQPGQDPLAVADGLGRPVAILRLGARIPDQSEMQDSRFYYGSPPFVAMPSETKPQTSGDCPQFRANENGNAPSAVPTSATPTGVKNLPPPPRIEARNAGRGTGGEG